VLPIPAEQEPIDADPVIVKATPKDMPGPLFVDPKTPQTITLTLRDADVADTLHIRVFRDYAKGSTGGLSDTPVPNDPSSGKEERTTTIEDRMWCPPAFQGQQVVIDVMVADRDFDPDINAEPQYRHILDGGKGTIRSWVVNCASGT
jgi:hypothetical protein